RLRAGEPRQGERRAGEARQPDDGWRPADRAPRRAARRQRRGDPEDARADARRRPAGRRERGCGAGRSAAPGLPHGPRRMPMTRPTALSLSLATLTAVVVLAL